MKKLDWSKLPFEYMHTNYNVRCYYKNGSWGELETSSSEIINMPIAATCLHYGQQAFEGLKAFRGKDGKIRIFRVDENAKRMQYSAEGILMPKIPESLFIDAVNKAVQLNLEFVPPSESGAALYIRPLLIGTGAVVGVKPSPEYLFLVFVTPVGPYFKEGFKPCDIVIMREFDRTAPKGTGRYKVGGNYAASLKAGEIAHEKGYAAVLYLDAHEKKYLDECGPANFFGIKNNTYITPKSESILASITNKSLMVLAEELGLKVEVRPVELDELDTFEEIGMCGTAAVISPIYRVYDNDTGKEYTFTKEPGPILTQLYNKLLSIQHGNEPDKYGWITYVKE